MKKSELKKFRERLKAERERILNGASKLKREELRLSADDLADETDLASSGLTQSMSIRLRDREASLLKKIENALLKIDRGEFGICESCEEPIEPKRLEARPMADLCIGCKEAQEVYERSSSPHRLVA